MVILAILFFLLLGYVIFLEIRGRNLIKIVLTCLFVLLGFIIFKFENVDIFFYLTTIIVANLFFLTYGIKKHFLFVALLLILLPFANGIVFAQGIFLGILPGAMLMKGKNTKENKKLEMKRDGVHLAVGVVILLLAYTFSFWGIFFIIALIILGFALGNYIRLGKKQSFLSELEREYTPFGYGAIWLALGILLTLGFLFQADYVFAVLSTILIGDPIATIVGIIFGNKKLPYNKEKSIAGTAAFFFSTFLVSYFFLGYLAFAIALAAALVESIDCKIDDNILIPFFLVLIISFYYFV
ncbi:MAG: diacylglycerol/polyprenol kinase family protein [Candidatus Micrarchaeia archaeon]